MTRGVAQSQARSGIVAALGVDAVEGARAWGVALRRPVQLLDGLDDLASAESDGSLTLAVTPGALTTQMLMRLTVLTVERNLSIGVVRATRTAARRHAILSDRRVPARLTAYSHLAPCRRQWVGDCPLYGRDGAQAFASSATTRLHDAIFMQTHGNGSNMALGPLVVCARAGAPFSPDAAGLTCFAGGPCLRGAGPAAQPDRFIAPAKIRADTVVLDTCWGAVPDDGVWAPATTLAHMIMSGGWTRNLLTPFSLHEGSVGAFRSSLRAYQQAAPLGALSLALNRQDTEAGRLPGWVLLGDPDVRRAPAAEDDGATRGVAWGRH